MLRQVLSVAERLRAVDTVVVLPPGQDDVRAAVTGARIVEQAQPLGTGHAVQQARELLLGRSDRVLVLYGDTPLVRPETADKLVKLLGDAVLALLSVELDDPKGYGRVRRDEASGRITRVVEEADAELSDLAIREVNSGLMAFRADWLWQQLPTLPERANGEFYLTDLVERALAEGLPVASLRSADPSEVLGVNTQRQLAEANRLAWLRQAERLMDAGVTVLDPRTTYVEADVEVASGSVVHPNTHLRGRTSIGAGCQIGPDSTVVDSQVGDRCTIWASVVEGSQLEEEVRLGPFSHVRPGCYLERRVHLGNFAEIKATRVGAGTQMHHFSYLGDAEVGARVNIGAGSITCNYDGEHKHRTIIGDDTFVGSDSMLIAPVELGPGARTGAGSVVTRDVPPGATVVGVPARQLKARPSQEEASPSQKDGG